MILTVCDVPGEFGLVGIFFVRGVPVMRSVNVTFYVVKMR